MYTGIMILIFLGTFYLSVQFIAEKDIIQAFTIPNRKFNLAAQCNCLPGYIPSRNAGCIAGTEYFCKRICTDISGNDIASCDPINDVKPCY
jgi:hypothetical protein